MGDRAIGNNRFRRLPGLFASPPTLVLRRSRFRRRGRVFRDPEVVSLRLSIGLGSTRDLTCVIVFRRRAARSPGLGAIERQCRSGKNSQRPSDDDKTFAHCILHPFGTTQTRRSERFLLERLSSRESRMIPSHQKRNNQSFAAINISYQLARRKNGKPIVRRAVRDCNEHPAIGSDLIATHKPRHSPDLPGCGARVYQAWTAKTGERFVAQEIHLRDWRRARTAFNRRICCPCPVRPRG